MKKFIIFALLLLLLDTTLSPATIQAAPAFNDPAFGRTWNRVDLPVQNLPGLGRGYTWGPAVAGSEQIQTEPYGGKDRRVQYFDKGRMELNNPNGNPNDLFYVTSGLLVKELVTGVRQDGDNNFTELAPSTVQVAGDPNEGNANAVAPVYASFKKVVTFFGSENGVDQATGSQIGKRIDKAGNVNNFTPPEVQTYGAYDPVTRHNIADVFVKYGNLNGQIWDGNNYTNGSIFFGNATYILGRPVSEAYWTRAVVAGKEQDVLVQLFERRALTYTPANPAGFKVEMGNVGQHYFRWRYQQNGQFPTDFSQYYSAYIKSGPIPTGGSGNLLSFPVNYTGGYQDIALSGDTIVYGFGFKVGAYWLGADRQELTPAWYSDSKLSFSSTPLIHGDSVYVGSVEGQVFALRMADGSERWASPRITTPEGSYYNITALPVTDGNYLYVTASIFSIKPYVSRGKILALRLSDGTIAWQTPELGALQSGTIFGFNGNLYAVSLDGKVYAYTRTGTAVANWQTPTLGQNLLIRKPAFDGNRLYIAEYTGQLWTLDNTGVTVQKVNLNGDIEGTPAVVGNKVYVSVQSRETYGTGKIVGLSTSNLNNQILSFGYQGTAVGSVVIVDGYLYFNAQINDGARIYQVNLSQPDSGKIIASLPNNLYNGSPLVAGGLVYLGPYGNNFYIVK